MPKETIAPSITFVYDAEGKSIDVGRTGRTVPAPEGGRAETTPAVALHWSRDLENVQVSIEFPRETWLSIADELRDDPRVTAKAIYSDGLSREEINKMIRTLRRARDAAFGADE